MLMGVSFVKPLTYAMFLRAILLFVSCVASASSEDEFRCKPRPGCHLAAQCDPANPMSVEYLQRNEYPMTCVKAKEEGKEQKTQTSESLLDLFSSNRQEVVALRKGNDANYF